MPTVLLVTGLVLVVLGVVVFLFPVSSQVPEDRALAGDLGKIMEELNKLLDKFDKRYRPGILLMFVGLTLIGVGAYLETRDAADEADKTATAPVISSVLKPG